MLRQIKLLLQSNEPISKLGYGSILLSYFLIVFSSPMPIQVGWIDVVMGAGLVLGVLMTAIPLIVRNGKIFSPLFWMLCFLIILPTFIGIARENGYANLIRDILPVMFMSVLPLLALLYARVAYRIDDVNLLIGVILIVGAVSSLQFYLGTIASFGSFEKFNVWMASNYATATPAVIDIKSEFSKTIREFWIKVFDPAVIFSAIYLICRSIEFTLSKHRRPMLGILALAGGAFCGYSFSILGLRAFAGLTVLAIAIFLLHLIAQKKVSAWQLILLGGVGLLISYPYLANLIGLLLAKQKSVGMNNKAVEFSAVFDTVMATPLTLLFGVGWGGVFTNPIYANPESTRFTHSLISFWLLKTGLIGFTVMASFVILLFRRVSLRGVWASSRRLAISLAASAVIIIGLLFEPTYKMLSFGLIVGLLLAELSSPPKPAEEINIGQ
jgi:hypothetical protein